MKPFAPKEKKPPGTRTFSVVLPVKLCAELQEAADLEGIARNAFVRYLLEEGLPEWRRLKALEAAKKGRK